MIEIITIGDEILIGQIVDTNSAWMSAELNNSGFPVSHITSVHDSEDEIKGALDAALARSHIVLLTGGLGPTKDDITKQTLCRYFNTKLIYSEDVLQHIRNLYSHRPEVLNTLTESQALVPESCTVIQNTVGTAPVMWFNTGGKVVVAMPGVPFEMKMAMTEQVIPRLRAQFPPKAILHRTVQVYGYSESALAMAIADWENGLPDFLHLAYLPTFGMVRLRLSGISDSKNRLDNAMARQFEALRRLLGKSIVAEDDLPIEYTLYRQLKERSQTIALAESCTGGNIAHRLTLISGSSAVFKGAVVAYANQVKVHLLEVSPETLHTEGAVSRHVVEQMAVGARKLMQTNWAIAVSGIAGPDGGTDEKPIGTVWIAVAGENYVQSQKYAFGRHFPREIVIERATTAALMMALEAVVSHPD